jgi:putative ABC transport system ATP-binding protein
MTNSPAILDPQRLAVSAEGVVKTYERGALAARVLDGVDLHVERGRSVFLAGPSGSGKTTLLSILGCILSADEGRVNILGQDLSALSTRERSDFRRDRIGFVFQRFHLIRGLTACENIGVPLVLRGVDPPLVRRRAMELLDMVGLADKAHAHSQNLSAGQCQRVALARALANDPELILADEPTASLDATKGHDVMELLWRLTTHQGRTVVVVTHDPRIFCFADYVHWLDNGHVAEKQEPIVESKVHPTEAVSVAMPSFPSGFIPVVEVTR